MRKNMREPSSEEGLKESRTGFFVEKMRVEPAQSRIERNLFAAGSAARGGRDSYAELPRFDGESLAGATIERGSLSTFRFPPVLFLR